MNVTIISHFQSIHVTWRIKQAMRITMVLSVMNLLTWLHNIKLINHSMNKVIQGFDVFQVQYVFRLRAFKLYKEFYFTLQTQDK